MRVLAFCGSPRKSGNTYKLLNSVLAPLQEAGSVTEVVQLAEQKISGCTACFSCFENKNCRCIIEDDPVNEWIGRMVEADAILLGSPSYFGNVSSEMKALIDRSGMVCRANNYLLRRKPGAAVVAARRAGALHTLNSIHHWFLIGQMILVGSSYWNIGVGRERGDVSGDEEGVTTMEDLGKNLLWLLHKIKK